MLHPLINNAYQQDSRDVLAELGSSPAGLTTAEAERRRQAEGPNELQTDVPINRWQLLLSQFRSALIYILLVAVGLSVVVGEYADAIIILLILFFNALLGYFQEVSAQESLQALRRLNTVQARVYRDGNLVQTDARNLVRGDVVWLEAGDRVPADCRILEASRLKVEESALTGESLPVDKNTQPVTSEAGIGDQKNMLFSSTALVEGSARAVVVRTGMQTEIGKITGLVKEAGNEQTPLQKRLDVFGRQLGYLVMGICLVILILFNLKEYFNAGTLDRATLVSVFMVAISLAVAAIPEGLPAVVTIALSVGVKRLFRKDALVRKLASVETLGSCDVICSDKTGTLTQNQMTVKKAWVPDREAETTGTGYAPEGSLSQPLDPLLFEIGYFCNNASVYVEEGAWVASGDPTEAALLVSGRKAGVETSRYERLAEYPFDADRKRMSVLLRKGERQMLFTKGAPDQMLEVCTHFRHDGKRLALSAEVRAQIERRINRYSEQALRVLAFACKEMPDTDPPLTEEAGLTFVGLQAMMDPPRPDVKASVEKTQKAGIRVMMITGDYRETALAIGEQIGIRGKALTGTELGRLSEADLMQALEAGTNIFARVVPEHKQKIVSALQKQGHIVAMTGDGVNDAPALKKADIGIAVGSGTEVAKEASDFILLNDSFTNIVLTVEEGRGIYQNIQKSIMNLLAANLAEVLTIFLAVLLGWEIPLTAVMLLWINLITDGAPALALSVDPYGGHVMEQAPKKSDEQILSGRYLTLVLLLGGWTTLGALGLFWYFGGHAAPSMEGQSNGVVLAQTVVFTFFALSEIVLLLVIRNFFEVPLFTNRWLWLALLSSVVLQVLVLYTPLNQFFGVLPLALPQWEAIGMGLLLLALLSYATGRLLRPERRDNSG